MVRFSKSTASTTFTFHLGMRFGTRRDYEEYSKRMQGGSATSSTPSSSSLVSILQRLVTVRRSLGCPGQRIPFRHCSRAEGLSEMVQWIQHKQVRVTPLAQDAEAEPSPRISSAVGSKATAAGEAQFKAIVIRHVENSKSDTPTITPCSLLFPLLQLSGTMNPTRTSHRRAPSSAQRAKL
jgi:hypothetical protein